MKSAFSICWLGASLLFTYMVFQKMDLTPWKGAVPGYNLYTLCEEFYGNGWRVFLFLIPVYGLILWIKMGIKWAQSFGKSSGYGVGIALLTPIFLGMLAFEEKACYQKTV